MTGTGTNTKPSQSANKPSTSSNLQLQNRQWLTALACCKESTARLRLRNRIVEANLGLVRQVACRQAVTSSLELADLVSVGAIGLIRAIDSFAVGRGVTLSTYAVPFIRGAMQHEERDRYQPLKTPRRLRELQQRANNLVEKRQRQGLAPLADADLAMALGCRAEQLREARAVREALRLRSLDAPLRALGPGEPSATLQELVSNAVASPHPSHAVDPNQHWLSVQLQHCSAQERALLNGRCIEGLSWSALGDRLGLEAREAEQRCLAVVVRLQVTAPWSNAIRPMARQAAIAV